MEAYPPPPQGTHPPPLPQPNPAYPPQTNPAYPPQTGYHYPPNTNAPPAYYAGQTPAVPQTSSNVIVVQQQPTQGVHVTRVRSNSDRYFTMSVVLTVLCFCCGWYSLFCTVPAICCAISAKEADQRGDYEKAKSKGTAALILNIIAIIWWFVGGLGLVGGAVGYIVPNNVFGTISIINSG